MSKEALGESSAHPAFVPSAPPSYDEAMQQAGAVFTPMPGPYTVQPQPLPMPMQMPMPMPMPMPAQPAPTVHAPAPATATVVFTSLGRDSTLTVCHKCNKQVTTRTSTSNKCLAWGCCCVLLWSGVGTLCSCIPFCMDSCKIVRHRCPNCHTRLGTYRS